MIKVRIPVNLDKKTMKPEDRIKLDYKVKKIGGRRRNIPLGKNTTEKK